MKGVVTVDTNMLLLLVVGSASKSYIGMHRRLQDYTVYDFELLGLILQEFSEIVLLPHILAETSNLSAQIANPARGHVLNSLADLIGTAQELPLPSAFGTAREEFGRLGLTDAVILHLCSMNLGGLAPTLITSDGPLARAASAAGQSVLNHQEWSADPC